MYISGMNFIKDNWFKAGILIALLLIAYSIYQVLVVRPQVEKAEERAEKVAAQAAADFKEASKKEQAKKDLNSCLSDADTNYDVNWFNACKTAGSMSKTCIDLHDLTYQEYLKKYNLTEAGYRERYGITSTSSFAGIFDYLDRYKKQDCSCGLIRTTADRLDGMHKDDKNSCYIRYPQS